MMNLAKCLTFFVLIFMSSCFDASNYGYEGLSLDECNEDHLLNPIVDKTVEFEVYVIDLDSLPISGSLVRINLSLLTCDGYTTEILRENFTTDANGKINGTVPYHFRWNTDKGRFLVAIHDSGKSSKRYNEEFGPEKDFLSTIITLTELEK